MLMSLSFLPESSLFLGIIPALIFLYIGLKKFEGYFLEKIMFIMFVIGIISGFITVIVEWITNFPRDILLIFVFVVLFSFLEQIIKTAILNVGRFQNKTSTIFYGFSLGLGFGSIYPLFLIISLSQEIEVYGYISILVGSVGLILIHGLTGMLLGYGVYNSRIIYYYFCSTLILIVANVLMKIEYFQFSVIVFGIVVYYICKIRIMDSLSTNSNKRKRANPFKTQSN